MDFIETLSQEILTTLVPRLSEAVLRDIAAQLKQEFVFRYSEEEAAEKLGISPKTLAQVRKAGQIEYTYSALPALGTDRRLHGGRISYLPRHLDEYLARNEQKHFFGKLQKAA